MSFAELVTKVDRAVQQHLGGMDVIYTSSLGTVVVQGLFDANYALLEEGQAGLQQTGPAVWLKLADLPSDPSADDPVIEIESVQYEVREARPDGAQGGAVLLLLHRLPEL